MLPTPTADFRTSFVFRNLTRSSITISTDLGDSRSVVLSGKSKFYCRRNLGNKVLIFMKGFSKNIFASYWSGKSE